MFREVGFVQQATGHIHYSTPVPFRNAIFLWRVWSCVLLLYAGSLAVVAKAACNILPPMIRTQMLQWQCCNAAPQVQEE